jgi:hypothetical protein
LFAVALPEIARYIADANRGADVAELADAQPSGGCDRKVVEVQLLSSAPTALNFMKRRYLLGLCSVLVIVAASRAVAQGFKPIDRTKQADVNGKIISPDNLNLKNVAQPTRSFWQSPRSDERQSLPQVDLKNVDLQQLRLAGYSTEILPQQNFTAKRAAITEKPRVEKDVQHTKAPIKDRQLHPFAPGGEEELEKQLNKPH